MVVKRYTAKGPNTTFNVRIELRDAEPEEAKKLTNEDIDMLAAVWKSRPVTRKDIEIESGHDQKMVSEELDRLMKQEYVETFEKEGTAFYKLMEKGRSAAMNMHKAIGE